MTIAYAIRKLPEQFIGRGEVRGFQFSQISMTDRALCYEVRIKGTVTHYEVFRRKIKNQYGCKSYLTAKAFGIWAWTYTCLEEAIKKLTSIQ